MGLKSAKPGAYPLHAAGLLWGRPRASAAGRDHVSCWGLDTESSALRTWILASSPPRGTPASSHCSVWNKTMPGHLAEEAQATGKRGSCNGGKDFKGKIRHLGQFLGRLAVSRVREPPLHLAHSTVNPITHWCTGIYGSCGGGGP